MPDFSPAQPWRAKTHPFPSKATTVESTGGLAFLTRPPKLPRQLALRAGYVEDAFEAKTTLTDLCRSLLGLLLAC